MLHTYNFSRYIAGTSAVIFTIIIIGCTIAGIQTGKAYTPGSGDHLSLYSRAFEFQKTLMKINYADQYAYYSPEYRDTISLDMFIRHMGDIQPDTLGKTRDSGGISGNSDEQSSKDPSSSTDEKESSPVPYDKYSLPPVKPGPPQHTSYYEFGINKLTYLPGIDTWRIDGFLRYFNVISKGGMISMGDSIPALPAGIDPTDILNQEMHRIYHDISTAFYWKRINDTWYVTEKINLTPAISGNVASNTPEPRAADTFDNTKIRAELIQSVLDAHQKGTLKDAAAALEQALWISPDQTWKMLPEEVQQDSAAIEQLRHLLKFYREYTVHMSLNPRVWGKCGLIHELLGEYSDAAENYNKSHRMEPDNMDWMKGLSDNLFLAGDHLESLKIYSGYFNQYLYTRKQRSFLVASEYFQVDTVLHPLKQILNPAPEPRLGSPVFADLGRFFSDREEWKKAAICYIKSIAVSSAAQKIQAIQQKAAESGFIEGLVSDILPSDLMEQIPVISYTGLSRILSQCGIKFYYSDEYIGLTGVKLPCKVAMQSAAYFEKDALIYGKYSRIQTGSMLVPFKRHRGINAAILDPSTGDVKIFKAFDTSRKYEESAELAQMINDMSPGDIFLGAVNDEASRHLGVDAVTAMKSVGLQGTLLGKNRYSGIMIGVKGAREGAAIEVVAPAPIAKTLEPGNFPQDNKDNPLPYLRAEAIRLKKPVLYLHDDPANPRFTFVLPHPPDQNSTENQGNSGS